MKGFGKRGLLVGVVVQVIAACGADVSPMNVEAENTTRSALKQLDTTIPVFKSCNDLTFAPTAPTGFQHFRNQVLAQHMPHHSAQDVIGLPGDPLHIKAWFAYGLARQEMQDEAVNVTLDDCTRWSGLKTWTTSDVGTIDVPLEPSTVSLGNYDVVHEVMGDGTSATSHVWGLPAGTHFVVFDIDGTLTTDNGQFFDELAAQAFDGGYTPHAFLGAQDLTKLWLAKGYIPLFLTGRPHGVSDITRAWLKDLDFAMGPLRLTDTSTELAPNDASVGEFKAQFLASLQAKGYSIDYAYGNEPTDVYAYKKAGINMAHVFTIGSKAGVGGSQPLFGQYVTHLPYVQAQPNAVQPFSF